MMMSTAWHVAAFSRAKDFPGHDEVINPALASGRGLDAGGALVGALKAFKARQDHG